MVSEKDLLTAYQCFQDLNLLEKTIEESLRVLGENEETILKGVRCEAAAGNHAYVEDVRARFQARRDNLEQEFFRIRMQESAHGKPGRLAPPSLLRKKQDLSDLLKRILDEIEALQEFA